MEINDVAKLIELEKRKAGLELKKAIGMECEAELGSVNAQIREKASIEVVYPRQVRLDELEGMLKDFSAEQIKDALKARDGEIYELLGERASISRTNYENRFEIAKLAILLAKMDPVEKQKVKEAVEGGGFEAPLKIGSLDEDDRKCLSRFMCRCGIGCTADEAELTPDEPLEKEVPMKIENRKVWVDKQTSEQLKGNIRKMQELGSALQVRNAKRQIMEFDEEEEKRYASLQQEYLELLKRQDELLKDYTGELKCPRHVGSES